MSQRGVVLAAYSGQRRLSKASPGTRGCPTGPAQNRVKRAGTAAHSLNRTVTPNFPCGRNIPYRSEFATKTGCADPG